MADFLSARGWDSTAPIDTYWIRDDAIDEDKSDGARYNATLDPSALVVRHGAKPRRMLVYVPTPEQWVQIDVHRSLAHARLAVIAGDKPVRDEMMLDEQFQAHWRMAQMVAVELCVRFPDDVAARPQYRLGHERLPPAVMRAIAAHAPDLIFRVGGYVVNSYTLSDDEKKASSQESGPKTLSTSPTTAATPAASDGSGSTAAPTSAT